MEAAVDKLPKECTPVHFAGVGSDLDGMSSVEPSFIGMHKV